MPASDEGSIQHLTLSFVPVDVLANMFPLFSTVKELKCHDINPPQKVQYAHVQCGLGCCNLLCRSLFDTVLIIDVYSISACLETTIL